MEINYGITKWKIASYIIGTIGIGMNPAIFFYFFEYAKFDPYIYTILAINLTASIFWICGAALNKTVLMLILLVWWIIPVLVYLVNFFIAVIFDILSKESLHFDNLGELFIEFITGVPMLVIVIYTLAAMCYVGLTKAINRSRSEIPRMNVEYSEAKTRDFDYY